MLSALNSQNKDSGVSRVSICRAGCWAAFQNGNNLIGVLLPNSSHDTCNVTPFYSCQSTSSSDYSENGCSKGTGFQVLPSQRGKCLFPHQEHLAQVRRISKHFLHASIAVKEAGSTLSLCSATWLFKVIREAACTVQDANMQNALSPSLGPCRGRFLRKQC